MTLRLRAVDLIAAEVDTAATPDVYPFAELDQLTDALALRDGAEAVPGELGGLLWLRYEQPNGYREIQGWRKGVCVARAFESGLQ